MAGNHESLDGLGRNLTWGLTEALGRAIVAGDYIGKPFPTEAEIVIQHGVSRSVTREAVKVLSAKGLLSGRPRQGTFVRPEAMWNLFDTDVVRWLLHRPQTTELLRHFNRLRAAVEPEAAALAASHADDAQIAEIRDALTRMEAAENGGDDTLDADTAYHVAILRASCNPFYIQLHDVVTTALRVSIRYTNRRTGQAGNLNQHAAVYDAIARRDADAARTLMRAIIDDALTTIDSPAG